MGVLYSLAALFTAYTIYYTFTKNTNSVRCSQLAPIDQRR